MVDEEWALMLACPLRPGGLISLRHTPSLSLHSTMQRFNMQAVMSIWQVYSQIYMYIYVHVTICVIRVWRSPGLFRRTGEASSQGNLFNPQCLTCWISQQ